MYKRIDKCLIGRFHLKVKSYGSVFYSKTKKDLTEYRTYIGDKKPPYSLPENMLVLLLGQFSADLLGDKHRKMHYVNTSQCWSSKHNKVSL